MRRQHQRQCYFLMLVQDLCHLVQMLYDGASIVVMMGEMLCEPAVFVVEGGRGAARYMWRFHQ